MGFILIVLGILLLLVNLLALWILVLRFQEYSVDTYKEKKLIVWVVDVFLMHGVLFMALGLSFFVGCIALVMGFLQL